VAALICLFANVYWNVNSYGVLQFFVVTWLMAGEKPSLVLAQCLGICYALWYTLWLRSWQFSHRFAFLWTFRL